MLDAVHMGHDSSDYLLHPQHDYVPPTRLTANSNIPFDSTAFSSTSFLAVSAPAVGTRNSQPPFPAPSLSSPGSG